jgi:prepilin-type N-terminal cleavage/methylation domain-containing protein
MTSTQHSDGQHQEGFSLVEVLLAVVIFGFLAVATIGAILYGRSSSGSAGDRTRAVQLADEAIQAVRNIRDASFSSLVDGTYGLTQTGSIWTLAGNSDNPGGVYTRRITVASVSSTRKTITVNVSWPQGATTQQTSVVSQLTNWPISSTKTWPHAMLAGSANPNSTNDAVEIATQGNYAYILLNGAAQDFVVVDISAPSSPTIVKTLSLTGTLTDITVSGNYAYVAGNNNSGEMLIIDISNPTTAHQVGAFSAQGNADGLAVRVVGNYAYLTRAANNGNAEFSIINISNPAQPFLAGSYGNNVTMNSLYINGNYAYVGTATGRLLVINIASWSSPSLSTDYDLLTSGAVTALDGFDNTLLVGQTSTLSIINIATPSAATRLSTLTTTGSVAVHDIVTDSTNNYTFLATPGSTTEFQVADLSSLSSPSIVRTVDIPGNSTLNGVVYNSTYNEVIGASASDTQEIVTFIPN